MTSILKTQNSALENMDPISALITTRKYTKKNITITPLAQANITFDSALSGYTRLGATGYECSKASVDGYGSSYANVYDFTHEGMSIKNMSTEKPIKIDVTITVLYRKNS